MTAASKTPSAPKRDPWVQRNLENAPPLTDAQRARLAALLTGGERR